MGAPRWPVLAAAVMVGVVSGGGAAGLRRGRGVAARPEAVGVVLGEGSAASLIGGQGGGEMLVRRQACRRFNGVGRRGSVRRQWWQRVRRARGTGGASTVRGDRAARRRDSTARRRPLRAALCRGRRRCAASTAVGRGVTSRRGVPCARTRAQGGSRRPAGRARARSWDRRACGAERAVSGGARAQGERS